MTGYMQLAIKNYVINYKGLPKACWESIGLTFVESLAIGMCFFLSLYFVDNLHFTVAMAGILISCYGIGTMIGGIIGGKLADRISAKMVSAIGLLFQGIAFLLLAQLRSPALLMVNLFILGLAGYTFKTSNDVWMLNQCRGDSDARLKAINLSRVAMNLGLGLSGAIIGALTTAQFQTIFYTSSIILLLAAIYLTLQKREPLVSDYCPNEKTTTHTITNTPNNQIVLLMLICLFLVGLMIAQLGTTYPLYVQDAFPQLGIKAVSTLFILDTVLIVLFQAPLMNSLKEHNKMVIAGLGAFMLGLGMVILSISFIFTLAVISCVIWTTGEMLFIPMSQLICYENGASGKKGQSMGMYNAVFAASLITGPALGGCIYHYLGGNTLWYLCGIAGIFCLVACYIKRGR